MSGASQPLWRIAISRSLLLLLLVIATVAHSGCVALPSEVAAELEPAAADESNHFRVNQFHKAPQR